MFLLQILFAIFLLPLSMNFQTKVCDCTNGKTTGIIQFADGNCEPKMTKQEIFEVKYDVYTDIRGRIKFPAYICGRWKQIKHISQNFFGQVIVVPDKIALETTAEECRIMREGRRCDEHPMAVSGSNWRYTEEPEEISYWLRTITVSTISCTLEEITLFQENEGSSITTPLGTVNASAGAAIHNHLTLVWETRYTTKTDPKPRHLESGIGDLIHTPNSSTYRLQDSDRQLDFHLKYNPRCLPPQTQCIKKNETFDVIGDNHLYVITKCLTNQTRNQTKNSRIIPTRPASAPKNVILNFLDIPAHLQYIRDQLTDHENDLSEAIHGIQCDLRRISHAQAISTAQYNGWLAASQLNLPECTKLSAAGQTVVAIKCKPVEVDFKTEITNCGPQPKYKNSTINLDGWELVNYHPCYWTTGFVNFNNKPYAYRNNTWQPIEATVILPQRKLTNSFRYEDVTIFDYEHQSNPAYIDTMVNHMNIMADIAAAMNEHSAGNFSENYSPSTLNVLVSAVEKEKFTTWFEKFKICLFISFLILFFIIILRIAYALGCFEIIWYLCCKPPPKTNPPTQPTPGRNTSLPTRSTTV